MNRSLLILLFAFWSMQVWGQCSYSNNTFQSGEQVSYKVFYKFSFLWFNAANVVFNVSDSVIENKNAFHFYSYGATETNYNWIYTVRDTFQSFATKNTLQPIKFSRQTSEGNYGVNNQYTFDHDNGTILSSIENSKTSLYHDTLKTEGCILDVLTSVYACRTIDVNKLSPNDTIPLKMLIDNKVYPLNLKYLLTEVTQLENGSSYRCKKFSIQLVEGTIFSGGEDLFVWISDDNARIPIRVEAKILVGSIIAQVNTITNNKWPLLSKQKNNTLE